MSRTAVRVCQHKRSDDRGAPESWIRLSGFQGKRLQYASTAASAPPPRAVSTRMLPYNDSSYREGFDATAPYGDVSSPDDPVAVAPSMI